MRMVKNILNQGNYDFISNMGSALRSSVAERVNTPSTGFWRLLEVGFRYRFLLVGTVLGLNPFRAVAQLIWVSSDLSGRQKRANPIPTA
jgi:hypothetical protein